MLNRLAAVPKTLGALSKIVLEGHSMQGIPASRLGLWRGFSQYQKQVDDVKEEYKNNYEALYNEAKALKDAKINEEENYNEILNSVAESLLSVH